ncbi:serine hydrolase domain-containing protein [Corynebacterium mendelii]|uniref:Beta-lactamase family protein n=1 Tax=Corynebacterium mendelii TaxID=2765362 RepID=A0A939E0M4_9CORY|nr:serine hydrolase domain-containing protein [Corynebacterium mendelii]MBN9644261.1 beta-lactamase family protein [Corynebacterium mendelii]
MVSPKASAQLAHLIGTWPVDTYAAAVIDNGRLLAAAGATDTVFPLASVTKPIVAYAVMVAVEEGVFDLDDHLGPEGSTVRHLLAHASGVGFDSPTPQKKPGERRIYSSAGYEILADAVGEASGIDFPDYLRQAVFEPLGMTQSRLAGSAGHGMESTVDDLVAFACEVLEPTLLAPATVEEMTVCQFEGLDGVVPGYGMHKPCPWGLGFEIKAAKTPHWTGATMPADTIGHFGQSGTYLWIHRPTGRAGIAVTNRDFGDWAQPLWAETNDAIWRALDH